MRLAWLLVPLAASLVVQSRGCAMVLQAGRRESRGELGEARVLARRGGFVAAGGAIGSTLFALGLTLAEGWLSVAVAVGVFGAALSGFAALLAGLSGKPRPTGEAASILLVLAAIALLVAPWV